MYECNYDSQKCSFDHKDVEIKCSDASTVPKNAGQTFHIFTLKIQMHSDAPNCWIKHIVWTFKQTYNIQKCLICQINIQIQHMNETFI